MKQQFSNTKFARFLKKRTKYIALPVMVLISGVVITMTVLSIMLIPPVGNDPYRGVGADGFRAGIERGLDLGVDSIVTKRDVIDVLGNRAKSVSDAEVSKVFNLNGILGQTLSFDFVSSDNVKASLYIDKKEFNSSATMESANILATTNSAGKVGEYDAYFMHAITFGSNREYYLLVIKDLKAYVFALVQPTRYIAISEVSAVATLKKLAQRADL